MARGSYSNRRKAKTDKVENLYKILGTRSNIGQDRIKEKYIEKLREFPPETHPEEFQEIRRAYETLKDVDRRKEYDMVRKYGDKLEKTMGEVMLFIEMGEFKKARNLLNYVSEIEPTNIAVKIAQAYLLLEMEELEEFQDLTDKIIEMVDIEEKQDFIFITASMLHSKGYYKQVLDTLNKGLTYVTDMKHWYELRIMARLDSGHFKEAWQEFEIALPRIKNLTIDDLDLLIDWLNIGMELEKWGEISKIQNYFKKLSTNLTDEEELSMLKYYLLEEAEAYVEVNRYREADICLQIASQIFQKDIAIKERRKEIQPIAKLERDLVRSAKDQEVIPYVQVKITDLFLTKYSDEENYEEFLKEYPHEMMQELESEKEAIAYGVMRIKKKYPSLYKEFNKELVELFDESTEGLNREQRRRLR